MVIGATATAIIIIIMAAAAAIRTCNRFRGEEGL